ncbi:MAG: nicotinate-nucleotide adenylyltransferase [Gemmatimonadetes bacterium]|nr:nicotinate-nucleotide adenylyltransferase [Gemmatimonadota bacterium]
MRRIGVIGGTFDPIHHGHLLLARFALEQIPLDEVLFIPAADPPLKQGAYAPAEERWIMVELAIADCPDFAASRLELDRPGKSYTVETLRLLHQLYSQAALFFIIGADNIGQLDEWHDFEGIFAQCTVVVGARPGEVVGDPKLLARLRFINTPLIELSSTEIRTRRAAGLSIRFMVPEAVEAHILAKGLYAAPCS